VETNGGVVEADKVARAVGRGERGCRELPVLAGRNSTCKYKEEAGRGHPHVLYTISVTALHLLTIS
jgi:hypothetical protein